jgi:hypothetical protein
VTRTVRGAPRQRRDVLGALGGGPDALSSPGGVGPPSCFFSGRVLAELGELASQSLRWPSDPRDAHIATIRLRWNRPALDGS